jgi:hypothetical protein
MWARREPPCLGVQERVTPVVTTLASALVAAPASADPGIAAPANA